LGKGKVNGGLGRGGEIAQPGRLYLAIQTRTRIHKITSIEGGHGLKTYTEMSRKKQRPKKNGLFLLRFFGPRGRKGGIGESEGLRQVGEGNVRPNLGKRKRPPGKGREDTRGGNLPHRVLGMFLQTMKRSSTTANRLFGLVKTGKASTHKENTEQAPPLKGPLKNRGFGGEPRLARGVVSGR